MAIIELQENELLEQLQMKEACAAVLVHTLFCGTCQLAEKMLEIVQATGVSVPLYKLNINYAPKLRNEWKITSVPCLVLLQRGELIRFEYAMKSVDHLYTLVRSLESHTQ